MRQMTYTLQLQGKWSPLGTSPNVMKATLVATGGNLTAAHPDGLATALEPGQGEQVTCESDVTFLGGFEVPEGTSAGEAGFKETGFIALGGGEHHLRFSTIGQGYIGPSADPHVRQGAVIYQVESGEGQFRGAQGLLTSTFLVSENGDLTSYQTGVIFIT
jgi:hypothetical protein